MCDGDKLPSVEEIHAIHYELEEQYDLTHRGTRGFFPDKKIRSVLDRAKERDDPYERAATILKGIRRIHVYEDGNKRTAWMAAVDYLDKHNLEPEVGGGKAERLLKRLQRFDVEEVATCLETGNVDDKRLE